MSPVLPFRHRLKHQYGSLALAMLTAVIIGFVATWIITPRQTKGVDGDPGLVHTTNRVIPSGTIEVIDGDTVRFDGEVYRLVGFDTPERGDRARCEDERRRSEVATARLRKLITGGDASLKRVACACRKGLEGTRECNFGRLCGSLSIGGQDVGRILISEGLAHPYVCGATSCPPRRPWC
jgi:endonuclease YncB( thermonuclease family)